MVSAKLDKLSQRMQQYNESVTIYFDDGITLCKKIDRKMPDTIIIQRLMKGINPEIRKELTRRQSTMPNRNEFLKQAKLEQDLHDRFTQSQTVNVQPEPILTYHLSANRYQQAPNYMPKYQREDQTQQNPKSYTMKAKSTVVNQNSYPTTHRANTTTQKTKPITTINRPYQHGMGKHENKIIDQLTAGTNAHPDVTIVVDNIQSAIVRIHRIFNDWAMRWR